MNTKGKPHVSDSHPHALIELVETLRRRVVKPNEEYHIILTPDRYTQTVESALFGGSGAIDCEVLTLSRLARRVCPCEKTISREGGVLVTARAVDRVKSSLVYYAGAARFADFAREVYDTLQQISSSATDIREAASVAVGATATKLNELALIKDEYDKIKAESAGSDATDRLTALQKCADSSELIKNSHFYAVGFSDPTRLNRNVLDAIRNNARSFDEFCARPPQKSRRSAEVICASDKISEYKEIAVRICEHVRNGGRYSDVSIISTSPRALERILREYGIAVYADEVMPLSLAAPFRAVADIHKISTTLSARGGIDCATLVALCKNPYSGCDADDAEQLQNYAARYGLTFVKRDFDFSLRRADKTVSPLDGAVRAKNRALVLVDEYDSHTGFAEAVRGVLDKGGFDDISADIDKLDTDTVAPVSALTELLGTYGSGVKKTDAEAMFAAARAVQIKSVPRERDCVTVTVPSALRLAKCKLLFVADFNEGVLPVASADTGMLCDDELERLGGRIEPTVREANRRSRTELAAVVCNADRAVFAYSTEGNAKPASMINELADLLTEYDCDKAHATLLHTGCTKLISKYAPTSGAARELAALDMTEMSDALRSVAGEGKAVAARFEEYLYGDGEPEPSGRKYISSSELTKWFECPYKRFLVYGVGLADRAKKRRAPDFGTVMHGFMQRFMSVTPYDCSRENIERTVDEALAELDMHPDPKALKRIYDNAEDYAAANVSIVEAGEYKPEKFEYDFYIPDYFGRAAKVGFKGKIDRFDLCGRRARVIDYKTGSDKYDMGKCLNGTQMQLPLYAAALRNNSANTAPAPDGENNVDYSVTGMFYVKLGKKFTSKKGGKPLDGCVVRDADIVGEYDKTVAPGEWSKVLPVRILKPNKDNPDGALGKATQKVLDRADFDALINSCKDNADTAVDEIATGYIARSPIDGACDYCSYRGLCGNVVFRSGSTGQNVASDGDEAEG